MTDCRLPLDRLAAYADGSLPDAERAEVEGHLAECASCRAELDWMRSLASQVGALPRSLPPSRELWSGIARRLPPRQVRRFIHMQPVMLAAAAIILMLLSVGITALWMRQRSTVTPVASTGHGPAVPLPQGNDPAAALATLVAQVRQLEQSLPPSTRALVAGQLQQIDGAIHESEAALANAHDNPAVERMLEARYAQRLALLKQARRVARSS